MTGFRTNGRMIMWLTAAVFALAAVVGYGAGAMPTHNGQLVAEARPMICTGPTSITVTNIQCTIFGQFGRVFTVQAVGCGAASPNIYIQARISGVNQGNPIGPMPYNSGTGLYELCIPNFGVGLPPGIANNAMTDWILQITDGSGNMVSGTDTINCALTAC